MGILRTDHINPEDRKVYQREFRQGLNLFEKALTEYKQSAEAPKKALLKQAMDQALHAMNQVANEALKDLKAQEDQLSSDYQNYTQDPSDDKYLKVQQDIEAIKEKIS